MKTYTRTLGIADTDRVTKIYLDMQSATSGLITVREMGLGGRVGREASGWWVEDDVTERAMYGRSRVEVAIFDQAWQWGITGTVIIERDNEY